MSNRFHQLEIGAHFKRDERGPVYTKTGRSNARRDDINLYFNSQALVIPFPATEDEVSWEELDFHTFDFTDKQRDDVIEQIVQRVENDYGDRFDLERVRKAVLAAHRTKPIRLIALLNACHVDFPADVIRGAYRFYDAKTDTMRDGWTAQHSEPHVKSIWEELFG